MDKSDILYNLIEFLMKDKKKKKPEEIIKHLQEVSEQYEKI